MIELNVGVSDYLATEIEVFGIGRKVVERIGYILRFVLRDLRLVFCHQGVNNEAEDSKDRLCEVLNKVGIHRIIYIKFNFTKFLHFKIRLDFHIKGNSTCTS